MFSRFGEAATSVPLQTECRNCTVGTFCRTILSSSRSRHRQILTGRAFLLCAFVSAASLSARAGAALAIRRYPETPRIVRSSCWRPDDPPKLSLCQSDGPGWWNQAGPPAGASPARCASHGRSTIIVLRHAMSSPEKAKLSAHQPTSTITLACEAGGPPGQRGSFRQPDPSGRVQLHD